MTSDIFQGLDLFHWEQDIATIIKLARDVQYRSVYSTHLMINSQDSNDNINDVLEFKILVSICIKYSYYRVSTTFTIWF